MLLVLFTMLRAPLQGHLTAEQEQALAALRARFPESAAFHSDYDLLRWLPCCVHVLPPCGTGHGAALVTFVSQAS